MPDAKPSGVQNLFSAPTEVDRRLSNDQFGQALRLHQPQVEQIPEEKEEQ